MSMLPPRNLGFFGTQHTRNQTKTIGQHASYRACPVGITANLESPLQKQIKCNGFKQKESLTFI
jgi:hypothetical protein